VSKQMGVSIESTWPPNSRRIGVRVGSDAMRHLL
jgi:hypothetical protein